MRRGRDPGNRAAGRQQGRGARQALAEADDPEVAPAEVQAQRARRLQREDDVAVAIAAERERPDTPTGQDGVERVGQAADQQGIEPDRHAANLDRARGEVNAARLL